MAGCCTLAAAVVYWFAMVCFTCGSGVDFEMTNLGENNPMQATQGTLPIEKLEARDEAISFASSPKKIPIRTGRFCVRQPRVSDQDNVDRISDRSDYGNTDEHLPLFPCDIDYPNSHGDGGSAGIQKDDHRDSGLGRQHANNYESGGWEMQNLNACQEDVNLVKPNDNIGDWFLEDTEMPSRGRREMQIVPRGGYYLARQNAPGGAGWETRNDPTGRSWEIETSDAGVTQNVQYRSDDMGIQNEPIRSGRQEMQIVHGLGGLMIQREPIRSGRREMQNVYNGLGSLRIQGESRSGDLGIQNDPFRSGRREMQIVHGLGGLRLQDEPRSGDLGIQNDPKSGGREMQKVLGGGTLETHYHHKGGDWVWEKQSLNAAVGDLDMEHPRRDGVGEMQNMPPRGGYYLERQNAPGGAGWDGRNNPADRSLEMQNASAGDAGEMEEALSDNDLETNDVDDDNQENESDIFSMDN